MLIPSQLLASFVQFVYTEGVDYGELNRVPAQMVFDWLATLELTPKEKSALYGSIAEDLARWHSGEGTSSGLR